MRRKFLHLGIICIIALVAGMIWMAHREKRLSSAFTEMQPGTKEDEARARLGYPWKVGACGQIFGGSFSSGCRKEYIYASPFAPIIPRYWALYFDEKGRLIDKYKFQSP
jgi:hypothetical protein